jgi:protoporphyrinogen oxidase
MDADRESVVIIGGGPSGLTAAAVLTDHFLPVVVLEKYHRVGGLARTEHHAGNRFDLGGHRFFSKSKVVQDFWEETLSDEFITRPRLSRIFYRGRFFDYPLQAVNALRGLGLWEGMRIIASYLRWQMFPYRREDTFEQWVTNRFGRRLFQIFFQSYTEKVWGIPCSELKAEWAAQRIKDLSLRSALLDMFWRPRQAIKSLIREFQYPRLGPGQLWETVQSRIERAGGKVLCESDVIEIRRQGNVIQGVWVNRPEGRQWFPGSAFLSSMPLSELILALQPAAPPHVIEAARQLKYRDFLTVGLVVRGENLFPDNWIYVHDPNVQVGRIQNFGNWSPDMVAQPGTSCLGLEYFCQEGDALWNRSDADLIQQGTRELEQIGLVQAANVVDGCVFRVAKSYPVYDSDYRQALDVLRRFVQGLANLQTIGRNGLHRYNNQDHAMITGMLAVRNLLYGERHDLWQVNADQEYHELERSGETVNTDFVLSRPGPLTPGAIPPSGVGESLTTSPVGVDAEGEIDVDERARARSLHAAT